MSCSRRWIGFAPAALAFASLGCDRGGSSEAAALRVTVNPASVATDVGASVVIAATVAGGRAASVRWRSERPDLVQLDTTVAADQAVVLRALRTGSTTVSATVSSGSDVVVAVVPVAVAELVTGPSR